MTNGNNGGLATLTLKGSTNESISSKYTLSTTENTVVGRSPDCEIPLDPHEFVTVSRRHAEIKLVDGTWQINDLGTTNGTLVNDLPIDNLKQLESGDRITLGKKGPEFAFECLTLNATVMVQPTEMKVEAPNTTIPAAKEVKSEATAPIAEAKPTAKKESSVKHKSESKQKSVSEPIAKEKSESPADEPVAKQEPATEPTPKAKAEPAIDAASPINTSIAAKSDKTLWNLISTTEICQITENSQPVLALAFSPNGQILASATKDKTIKLWNLANQTEIASLTGHKLAPNALAFSPDGKTLASGGADKTTKLWNLDSKEETASFGGHKLAINALCFSPDGKTLASGSADKTIKLWKLDSQSETGAIAGHKLAIESIAFSPDGKTIASGSKDKTVEALESRQQRRTSCSGRT